MAIYIVIVLKVLVNSYVGEPGFYYNILFNMSKVTYLKCRHNQLDKLIKSYKQTGQGDVSLNDLLNDVQPQENIGHLNAMMKAEILESDGTRRPRFFIQYTGMLESCYPLIVNGLRERLLHLLKAEASCEDRHDVLESIVKDIGINPAIRVLEFIGYKRGEEKKCIPVTLGACIFNCARSYGSFIYNVSG